MVLRGGEDEGGLCGGAGGVIRRVVGMRCCDKVKEEAFVVGEMLGVIRQMVRVRCCEDVKRLKT